MKVTCLTNNKANQEVQWTETVTFSKNQNKYVNKQT